MSKSGRKRRSMAARKPSGRIREVRQDNTRQAMWNRLKHGGEKFAQNPIWQTRRGELFFHHHITETQMEAADRWARSLERYDRLNGYRRSPSPIALERMDKGREVVEDTGEVAAFLKRFHAAHRALLSSGKLAEAACNKLARDEVLGDIYYVALRAGLDALSVHFGLVKKGS